MYVVEVIADSKTKRIECAGGENLLNILVKNGFKIIAPCGGKGKCGKCKAKLRYSDLPIGADENGDILTCKHIVNCNISIELKSVGGSGVTVFMDETPYESDKRQGYGVAVDIGTTTVAAYLVDLVSGDIVDKACELNPQYGLGADVISRIKSAEEGKLALLNKLITDKVSALCLDFLKKVERIDEVYVAANTTMLHLFANVDPTPLGKSPFEPVFTDEKVLDGSAFGLNCSVTLLPSVSAYIGSDITAGVIATDMNRQCGRNLLIDIGTNGEMALSNSGKITVCSTAAGPCLEGANIECGMGGVAGAIDSFKINNEDILFTTISGESPKGICGSGLIDIVGELLRVGVIDESGCIDYTGKAAIDGRISDGRFKICDNIYISQKDIREFQLAKSAIYSGVLTLLMSENLRAEEIDNVYIAGGLGFHLSIESALAAGLLPRAFEGRIKQVGNTSGKGAVLCMVSGEANENIRLIADNTEVIELSASKEFMSLYIENMFFA